MQQTTTSKREQNSPTAHSGNSAVLQWHTPPDGRTSSLLDEQAHNLVEVVIVTAVPRESKKGHLRYVGKLRHSAHHNGDQGNTTPKHRATVCVSDNSPPSPSSPSPASHLPPPAPLPSMQTADALHPPQLFSLFSVRRNCVATHNPLRMRHAVRERGCCWGCCLHSAPQ